MVECVISRVTIQSIERKRVLEQTCRLSHLSVRLSVCRWMSCCGKTADWIWMPFGVVSGVGRGMGVFDGSGDRRTGRDSFGTSEHVTSEIFPLTSL